MSDPASLDPLVDWMRRRGVVSVRLPDGTELDLGPEPPSKANGAADRVESAEEELKRLRAEMREELVTRFAHVGHEPTDEEVDAALRQGGWIS